MHNNSELIISWLLNYIVVIIIIFMISKLINSRILNLWNFSELLVNLWIFLMFQHFAPLKTKKLRQTTFEIMSVGPGVHVG